MCHLQMASELNVLVLSFQINLPIRFALRRRSRLETRNNFTFRFIYKNFFLSFSNRQTFSNFCLLNIN